MAFDAENNGYAVDQFHTQRIAEPREAVTESGAYGINHTASWEQNLQASQQTTLNRFVCPTGCGQEKWEEQPTKDSCFVVYRHSKRCSSFRLRSRYPEASHSPEYLGASAPPEYPEASAPTISDFGSLSDYGSGGPPNISQG